MANLGLNARARWCYNQEGNSPFSAIVRIPVNRAQLRQLANDRIEDARILLANGRWSAAYYLAGYAVECGLKACILAYVEATGIIFKDKKFAEKCWTHHLEDLVRQAGLEKELEAAKLAGLPMAGSWGIVRDWNEISRYEQRTKPEAEGLYQAITHDPDGVFLWIQKHW